MDKIATTWFYYDIKGIKRGPLNDQQLKSAVMQQVIKPETLLEDVFGHSGKACQIQGLFPANASQANVIAPPTVIANNNPSLGDPIRKDGPGDEPEIHEQATAGLPPKNRVLAGLLAVFVGWFGIHRFYLGSWGSGLLTCNLLYLYSLIVGSKNSSVIDIPTSFLAFLSAAFILGIIGLVDGVKILKMNDETFETIFSRETESPFRSCGCRDGIMGCGCLIIIIIVVLCFCLKKIRLQEINSTLMLRDFVTLSFSTVVYFPK
ncbi:MAG: TM2 domain-containing protein [Planctomycetia bacterium]|nr:TM2 domain-containing protein [Planctomycetia bacterium]